MKTTLCVLLAAGISWQSNLASSAPIGVSEITGLVADTSGQPVIGATVTLSRPGDLSIGVATDDLGSFRFRAADTAGPFILTCRAIGYESWSETLTSLQSLADVKISMVPKSVDVGGFTVRPRKVDFSDGDVYGSKEIHSVSRSSLVSNNPIDAVREPQISRQGSAYSSKLRINGTIPSYYLNGIPIGSDPNHYGMFSIIPAPAVGKVAFHGSGTSSAFEVPATLELSSPTFFNTRFGGNVEFSFVQATTSASWGNDRFFGSGTVRKSVLDKLVNEFAMTSNRRTLPPTNFQDVFVSSGWRMSEHQSLYLDQYYTRDYLAYNLGPTPNHPYGLSTYQHMSEQFQGIRLLSLYGSFLISTTLGRKSLGEEYQVYPNDEPPNYGLHLDLSEKSTNDLAGLQLAYARGGTQLTAGSQLEYVTDRSTRMKQQNWNFLPPDANSDNPYYYQNELNSLYGEYAGDVRERNAAGYLSLTQRFGPLSIESGLRYEQFGNLEDNRAVLMRERVTWQLSDRDQLSLYGGTFAENPVRRVLDPYQVLVRANLGHLSPVRTKLLSASFRHDGIKGEIFAKRVSNLPVLVPDYTRIASDQTATNGFIRVESSGAAEFYGADLSGEWKQFLDPKLSLYASYGFTYGQKQAMNVTVPYELTARHKFQIDLGYRPSRMFHLDAGVIGHTGYPYTPTFIPAYSKSAGQYTSTAYIQYIAGENSARFPLNMSFNLAAGMNINRLGIYVNVTNATNRANPIINTADGFVYDAGLFPSIGMKMEF